MPEPISDTASQPDPATRQQQTETSKDVATALQISTLEKAQAELREKFLTLREKDILDLKESVSELKTNFKIAVSVGVMITVVATTLGIKQYGDIDKTLNGALQTKIDKSFGYYERFAKASTLSNNGACASAIPIFVDLASERDDDELVFVYLQNCYIETERYDEGYSQIMKLRERRIFPQKFRQVLSYNNAGYLTLVMSFSDGKLASEAFDLLSRAETIAVADNSQDLKLPLLNLSLYYLSIGDINHASLYAKRFRELEPTTDWWRGEKSKDWFKRLEHKRPNVKKQLEILYPIVKHTN